MKDIAKILSLVLVVLLLLPLAKIDYEQEFFGSEIKVKEYMNYFSLGLGIDQTLKTTADGESDKDKPDMSGSFIVLLTTILIVAGALLLNGLNLKIEMIDYVKIGVFGAITLLLLLVPGSVKDLELDGIKINSMLGDDIVKMSLFYFISLLSAAGITGIFVKEKFIDK